jgi:hypothetical protein
MDLSQERISDRLTEELVANLNRNVIASIKEQAPPRSWPVAVYDGRPFAMSHDSTHVREWLEGWWHYVDTSGCSRGSSRVARLSMPTQGNGRLRAVRR